LKADINERRIIINKLINSGINVTPSILEIFLKLDDPVKKIDLVIKEISFFPNFKSHLTNDALLKINDEEIKNMLKRVLIKDYQIKKDEKITNDNILTKNNSTISELGVSKENNLLEPQKKSVIISDTNELSKDQLSQQLSKIKLIESSKSTIKYKPLAKEYDPQYEILKDPTGKLFTNGDYQDFYDLTLDKFNRLKKLMGKRSEIHSSENINKIQRLKNKVEVSVIGLVNEIRRTKNRNFLIFLEDLTGLVNVIVRRDSENPDNLRLAEKILSDQMIYIEGTYNPGEKGKGGIIYCNFLSQIDIPRDYEPNKSPDPLSIALISDTHIGSKEFEKKLWNRFIAFLNGKIGNSVQREQAGRVKYIIINGDLIDGIGIYPKQQNDLIISDIYDQFKVAKNLLSEVPDYIKIFYSSGNHEPVRNALPRPAVPKKYSQDLINIGLTCIGNPSIIQTHNVNTLVFHGDSLLDLNMLIPGLENNKPVNTMIELLKCRHLAPVYGKKTQIAPTNKDWLVIDKIPDIFHTGHIHINGMGYYNNIMLCNSGCFQSQTEFMNSLGIHPTPGILSLIELDSLKGTYLDLKNNI